MNNQTLNHSIVSQSEATALKEMIFRRARERAQTLTDDIQTSYTSAVQTDIMDLARDSFVTTKNPFAQTEEREVKTNIEKSKTEPEEISFARKHVAEIKSQITYKNKNTNQNIANQEVESTMLEARADFSKKKSFMGALEFLNSQATIALIKNKGATFEALA